MMIDMNLIFPAAVFFITLLIVGGLFYYVKYAGERRKMVERLDGAAGPQEDTDAGDRSLSGAVRQAFLKIAEAAGNLSRPKREEDLSHMERTFLKAGYRNRAMVTIFFGVKILLAVALPAGLMVVNFLAPRPISSSAMLLILVVLALSGFYLPHLWLRLKLAARQEKILKGFPDALDLLVVCVESGMGLDAAINRVGMEMKLSNKAISEEFKLLNLELRAGKSRRDALRNLGLRTGLDDVNSLVTLLIQTDKFGTSVAQALRVHSDSMRTKRYQKAEELAMKLPVKILFPMLFCIFPSLFVIIMGPPLIQAFRIWTSTH